MVVLDVLEIRRDSEVIVKKLLKEGLVRYVLVGKRIVFFDRGRRRVVKNPENVKSNFFKDFGRGGILKKRRITLK